MINIATILFIFASLIALNVYGIGFALGLLIATVINQVAAKKKFGAWIQ